MVDKSSFVIPRLKPKIAGVLRISSTILGKVTLQSRNGAYGRYKQARVAYLLRAYSVHSLKLLCWVETNNCWRASSSKAATVCLMSSLQFAPSLSISANSENKYPAALKLDQHTPKADVVPWRVWFGINRRQVALLKVGCRTLWGLPLRICPWQLFFSESGKRLVVKCVKLGEYSYHWN